MNKWKRDDMLMSVSPDDEVSRQKAQDYCRENKLDPDDVGIYKSGNSIVVMAKRDFTEKPPINWWGAG